jgi:pimeloyl-ACP methyl ester carboxylesterase
VSTASADTARNVTVDGPSARFTYRRIGPRGGVPLVLLQRFRATIDWWDPEFLDGLAADHDVITFDNVGTGYTTGDPPDSVEALADGAAEFIDALGLDEVDVLGWTLGGIVAQHLALRRPNLVRRLVLAASNPGGAVPGLPPADERVRAILGAPEATADDMVYLFFPDTEVGRAAGHSHLSRVAPRLARAQAEISEAAARAQAAAIAASGSMTYAEMRANLGRIRQPVLYATGLRDVMNPALAAFVAVQHLPNATFLAYGDAGHAFLFQRADDFTTQVSTFLASGPPRPFAITRPLLGRPT